MKKKTRIEVKSVAAVIINPNSSKDSGIKWKIAPPSIVPAESDTKKISISFNRCLLINSVIMPIMDANAIRILANTM